MPAPTKTTIAPNRLLLLIAASSILLFETLAARSASAQDPPDEISLLGKVWDFRGAHPDFNVTPSNGYGHYAGNIALTEGGNGRPAFVGSGFEVSLEWRDQDLQPIAPHLFGSVHSPPAGSSVSLLTAPTIIDSADADTYDSSVGPYGGLNIGPEPTYLLDSTMPSVTEPTGLPPLVNDVLYTGDGVDTISSDLHCNTFVMRDHHKVDISGNVTILVEHNFTMSDHSRLNLLPGATLTLYVKGIALVDSYADLNEDSFDPSRLIIYNLGTTDFVIQDHGEAHVTLVSPNARLFMDTRGKFYGRFVGPTMYLRSHAAFHLDTYTDVPGATEVCGVAIDDSAGAAGIASSGDISSADSFDEWYHDILGTNLSGRHGITLTRNAAGVYEFISDSFYPIDGRLFGNEGDAHNNYFTFFVKAQFVYSACAGQFFEFEGSDDAWLFVDGYLGIDLGGLRAGTGQHVDFDRLGSLQDGQTYELHFYYAHRQPLEAVFRMRTNVPVVTSPPVMVSTSFD